MIMQIQGKEEAVKDDRILLCYEYAKHKDQERTCQFRP